MSEQAGGILEIKPSYQYERDEVKKYRANSITSNAFYAWQKDNMYKSSYNHFHSHDSNVPNNFVVPGYQGFLPSVRSQSLYGKGTTPTSKEALTSDRLDYNKTGIASTGFNVKREDFIDKSQNGFSSKYGKTALQKAHPNWSEQWKTSFQISYKNPKSVDDPNYRPSEKKSLASKHQNVTSGYSQNHAYLDGHGWKPNQILNPANIGSEYRNRFNPEKEFHRTTDVAKERKMKRKQMNYQYNY